MNKSIESILTRLISIIAKFLLVTFLAKNLSLSEYGIYQLVTYFVMISVYIYGAEYYMYGNREVAKGVASLEKINTHINFFLTLLPFTFLIQFAALFFLIPNAILTPTLIAFILVINFCDYFNQEIYRYLIMVNEITKANILLVVKSLVLLLLVLVYFFLESEIAIESTLWLMFISYLFLLAVSFIFFQKYIVKGESIYIKLLSFSEVKRIFRFLLPFLGLMVFTKGLEFFDKFAIEQYLGADELGIYAFLFSIASLINVFIVSGFYLVYLPKAIQLHERKSIALKACITKFALLTVVFSLILACGEIVFIDVLLKIIGKENLSSNVSLLYILLGAFFFLNMSLIPRLILYVANKDKTLMSITGILFFCNIFLNLFFLKEYGIEGAALILLITYFIGFLITSYKGSIEWKKITRGFL
ncbi:Membrane protein involved in the export of O-antigen and teichoic acid [Algibacter lectus]|uniref:polysaccharide biosynthesis C-terminal domain-containing protein n=1 Tax=Algibacter lectus TaxID=221126 RepID=UPI0008F3D6FB|nr:polysaccharide biosynthesis C-terminal domain-containing protein [Algibacter lectus]SFC64247.1 Membrane protein involved in the export of O-antigen and teichoic acid [Algibacter lectus]